MRLPKARLLAPLLSLALAGGLYLQMQRFAVEDDAGAYHEAIAQAARDLPIRVGEFEGDDAQLPPAAGKLLRPNVMMARRYTSPRGERVNLVIVQCFDSRDMSGHYPPNCYPGNGWMMGGDTRMTDVELWGRNVTMARYGFTRSDGTRTVGTVIYNFFVLPTRGFETSMSIVRKATGDYRARPYGAAQVQVIFDAGMEEHDRLRILQLILDPLETVIELIQTPKTGEKA
jgi:hypothetical protein